MNKTTAIFVPADRSRDVRLESVDVSALFYREDGTPGANFPGLFETDLPTSYGVSAMVWTSDDATLPVTVLNGISYFGYAGTRPGIRLYGDSYITSINALVGGTPGDEEIKLLMAAINKARNA